MDRAKQLVASTLRAPFGRSRQSRNHDQAEVIQNPQFMESHVEPHMSPDFQNSHEVPSDPPPPYEMLPTVFPSELPPRPPRRSSRLSLSRRRTLPIPLSSPPLPDASALDEVYPQAYEPAQEGGRHSGDGSIPFASPLLPGSSNGGSSGTDSSHFPQPANPSPDLTTLGSGRASRVRQMHQTYVSPGNPFGFPEENTAQSPRQSRLSPGPTAEEVSRPRSYSATNQSAPSTALLESRAAVQNQLDRIASQEESDRRMAERLQREEDALLNSLLASLSGHQQGQRGRGSPIPHQGGTRNDPIQVDSDSDVDDLMEIDADTNSSGMGESVIEVRTTNERRSAEGMLSRFTGIFSWQRRPPSHIFEVPSPELSIRYRDCAVCGDATPIADLPALANCEHEPETCAACFAAWIESELDKKGWRTIKCPGSECRILLAHHDVRQYATEEVFERYDVFAMRAALGDDPNFIWCKRPGCKSGQIHMSGEEGNIFTCTACGHRMCIIHQNTWHEGETCEEYEYRASGRKERDQKAQEAASVKAVGKLSKVCILGSL